MDLPPLNSKHFKLKIAACCLLTVTVLHTCIRIEVLNRRNEFFLPRSIPSTGNPKWRVAAEQLNFMALQRTVALDRMDAFIAQYPDEPVPSIEELSGPPYTPSEQAMIDTEMDRNRLNSELRDWVRGMGLLQYLIAPMALALSISLYCGAPTHTVRLASIACIFSNVASLCSMFYRGYFTSLGL